jgi:predicted phosphate transport protein (TIGR00153 family)
MFGFLKPREGRFFDLFQESSTLAVQASEEFVKMLDDLSHSESRSKAIKDIEHKADDVTHETIELLHKVFITPLDREDIHQLIKHLDDIVDFIDAAAQRVFLYGITKITPEAKSLAKVCVLSAEHVRSAVKGLANIQHPDDIMKECVEINRLENEADQLLRIGVAKLFREETDTKELIKLKEVYELLETVTDRCEDVANIIEGIVLEYA